MEILEITEDKKDVWNGFLLQNSLEGFLQSFEWGEFQTAVSRQVFRYAVFEHGKILAVASAVEHSLSMGLKYWYLPRGPIAFASAGDAEQAAIFDFFIKALKEKAKTRGVIFVRMEPPLEKSKRGMWDKFDLKNVAGSVQPKDTLVLDLQKSEEDLLGEMKPKTRYNIRLAEKKGVEVFSEGFTANSFEEFWKLIQETSSRDGIVSHSKDYYRKMLEVLGAQGNLKCKLYFARYENRTIAANIVLSFGGYVIYLHGASSNDLRNLMAPYLLQWRQIQDAKNVAAKTYDFWGITVDNAQPKWAGITRFKKGFGGKEVSYVGVYDLVINKFLYDLYARFRKM